MILRLVFYHNFIASGTSAQSGTSEKGFGTSDNILNLKGERIKPRNYGRGVIKREKESRQYRRAWCQRESPDWIWLPFTKIVSTEAIEAYHEIRSREVAAVGDPGKLSRSSAGQEISETIKTKDKRKP